MLRNRRSRALVFAFAVFVFGARPLSAAPSVGGHVKYQFSRFWYEDDSIFTMLGSGQAAQHEFDARLKVADRVREFWEYELHGEMLAIGGENYRTVRKVAASGNARANVLLDDTQRLFDLTVDPGESSRGDVIIRADRIWAGYSDETRVIRFGRQAITWGNGLLFQAMDLFNPFSPVEVDKDYKTGDDMTYAQYVFSSGADMQLLVVPRRDRESRAIRHDESSYAGKYHWAWSDAGIEFDALAARHYNNTVMGLGMNREVLGAIFRLDTVYTRADEDVLSLVANIDRGFVAFDHNLYAFLEYFRNGFGVAGGGYENLDPALTERIERGELYTFGRDSIGTGLRLEWTPRHNIFLTQIFNLHDGSGFCQYRSEIDVWPDVLLLAGVNVPYGGRNTEYGGVPVTPEATIGPGVSAFLRIGYFF